MLIIISTFVVVFGLIVSAGLLLFHREEMLQRISDVINPRPKPKSLMSAIQQTGLSIGGVIEHFDNIVPKSQAEVSVLKRRLQSAGFREESAVKVYNGSRLLLPLLLMLIAAVSGLGSMNPLLVYVLFGAVGFLAPDIWLRRRIKKRQDKFRLGELQLDR